MFCWTNVRWRLLMQPGVLFDVTVRMSIDPTLAEQELHAETLRRARLRMTPRERGTEILLIAGFGLAVLALWITFPPHPFALAPVILAVLVMVLAMRVRFDTPFGFTVATQLAFVPLMFAVPVAVVPIAVVVAIALAQLVRSAPGRDASPSAVAGVGNSWFAIGPAAVFAIAHTEPSHAGLALLRGGACGAVRRRLRGLGDALFDRQGGELGRAAWETAGCTESTRRSRRSVCLPPSRSVTTPLAALAEVPLLGLLAMFAQRAPRPPARACLELNNAYRGTALVLGDVVEADDDYTGEHSREVRRAGARGRRAARSERRPAPQPRVRGAAARRRQDRDPEGDHQQARLARRRRVGGHEDPHDRGPEAARPRRRVHARGRHHRPLPSRALGRSRVSRRPRRRGDPARSADHRLLRHVERDAHRPRLPQGAPVRVRARRAAVVRRHAARPADRRDAGDDRRIGARDGAEAAATRAETSAAAAVPPDAADGPAPLQVACRRCAHARPRGRVTGGCRARRSRRPGPARPSVARRGRSGRRSGRASAGGLLGVRARRRASRRELLVEAIAAVLFLGDRGPAGRPALAARPARRCG